MQETRLGPYSLLAELGSGGMGMVWKAAAPDGAVVALKVVHEHVAATPGFLERFLREGEVGRSVRHENVVSTLATGEDAGRHWIALEYVEGQTLRGLADEMGTVPEELCRHVGREIAKGLAALHGVGLVHRDVKPENVLITRDHVVKVMDLGIARGADDEQRMTATGMFVGSVQYAAPEQFTGGGKGLDARADLHALGVTLYELATGVQPFEADDVSTTLRNVLHVVPRRAGEVNPQLSAFFEEVLRTLLEKEREKRFTSAVDLLGALTQGEDSAWWEERARAIRAATRKPLRRIRIPRETALYGREAELTTLRAAYDKAAAGDGAILLVEGEAGIGKSRLVDEFVGGLAQSGEDVNFLFGGYPPGGAATASGAFSTAWREHFGNDEDALGAALPEQPLLVPGFAALLRGDAAPADAQPLTKDALQTAFVRSAQTIAGERVTIVLIEDLHFAPAEGRALFASLAMATPGHRILLLGTTRPGVEENWFGSLAHVGAQRLVVPRLGPADLVKLLTDSLKSEHLATDLGGQIALKSDGNPFFAFEILRGLREGLFLTRRADGSWATTRRIEEIAIPPSIAELIQGRTSDLGDDDRNLLEAAACVGFEFEPGIVGAVLGLASIPTLQRLGAVEKRSRLVRASGRRFVFDHHQVQEHLYSGISEVLREQYHTAIADAIEARHGVSAAGERALDGETSVSLAEHLLRGTTPLRALQCLDAALAHLESGHANDAAVRLMDRALRVPGFAEGAARAWLLLRKADRLELLGRQSERRAALDAAVQFADECGEPSIRVMSRSRLGFLLVQAARAPEAAAVLDEALVLARTHGDRKGEASALGNLGSAHQIAGRYDAAREAYERCLELSRELCDRRGEAHAIGNLGMLCHRLDRPDVAREHMNDVLRLAEASGDPVTEALAVGNIGLLITDSGLAAQALPWCERHRALCRRTGQRRGEGTATGNIGTCCLSLGRYAEARREIERALTIAREVGNTVSESNLTATLGNLFMRLGDFPTAVAHLETSLVFARKVSDRRRVIRRLTVEGEILAAAEQVATAERRFAEALELCRLEGPGQEVSVRLARGAALAGCGLWDEACSEAESCLTAVRGQEEGTNSVVAATCLVLLAAGANGDAKAAEAALLVAGERLDVQQRSNLHLLLWRATRDRAHLAEAKRILDFMVEHAPPEFRESMLTNVRLHREILAACKDAGIE